MFQKYSKRDSLLRVADSNKYWNKDNPPPRNPLDHPLGRMPTRFTCPHECDVTGARMWRITTHWTLCDA